MNRKFWQINSSYIPALVLMVSAPLISVPFISQPAIARTVSFSFLQGFGRDGSTYKIMVKSQSGNRFFVWYYDSMCRSGSCLQQGTELLIEIDLNNYWTQISNPANGRTSRITKVEKVQ